MTSEELYVFPLVLVFIFLIGIVIGSFLNVCIYRIPKKEDIALSRSHCMSCGYQLKWYDLIPLFSYLFLKGKCRKCRTKISPQYPIIEGMNGVLYIVICLINGFNWESIIYCLMASALLTLSVIDFRTYEIPFGINVFLFILGIIHTILDYPNWLLYVIGMISVSLFLQLLFWGSGGRAIGGGDIKLMFACGLIIGWKNIILAFLIGCIVGSIIHLIRMKVSGEQHVLAMGPYLSLGILISALYGNDLIHWYLTSMMK